MTATTTETIAAWPELETQKLDLVRLAASAEAAGTALAATGGLAVVVDLDAGNGFRYLMILVHFTGGAAYHLPGDLLVALPEFHKSALMSATGYHVPSYVDDKLDIGRQHATVIGAFTTLLGDVLRSH